MSMEVMLMIDYEDMYYLLLNKITDTIKDLQEI